MDAEQKAKELIDKYSVNVVMWASDVKTSREYVKQCALIAVDELIEYTYYEIKSDYSHPYTNREFWEQVKQHINNL